MSLPDTALAREGRAVLPSAAPQGLVNLSARTYLLGKRWTDIKRLRRWRVRAGEAEA